MNAPATPPLEALDRVERALDRVEAALGERRLLAARADLAIGRVVALELARKLRARLERDPAAPVADELRALEARADRLEDGLRRGHRRA